MAMAAFTEGEKILFRRDTRSPSTDGELVVATLVDLLRSGAIECRERAFECSAVGIGAAAFVNFAEGLLIESPNIAWTMVPLRSIVERETGLSVYLDNDANVAALGELRYGVARGVSNFIYLTLGTGIGGAICIDGSIYRGTGGTAAELGHVVIDPEGPVCGCGRKGCLEALASGTALVREAELFAENHPESLMNAACAGDEKLDGKAVARAAEQGDTAALEAFDRISFYLGMGVANLIHTFDPEMVVLGGGVSESGAFLLEGVRRSVREHGIEALVAGVRVELSSLGNDAALLGAAELAREGSRRPA